MKLSPKSFKNFSYGYTRENAKIGESGVNLVDGSKNIDIVPQQDDGYSIEVMAGNMLYASIADKSIYNTAVYDNGDTDYLIAHTGDTVQEYNDSVGTWSVLKSGLTETATSISMANMSFYTIGVGTRLILFCTNGVETPFIYEKGQTPEVQDVTATDADGRTIRGHIAKAFDGRMWLNNDNRLHWSKQLDPFDWSAAADAGYKEFDATITAITNFSGGLLVSTTNGFHYVAPDGSGAYTFTPLSANYAINHKCLSSHGNYCLYYADGGLFPIEVTQQDARKVDNSLSFPVDKDLLSLETANAILFDAVTGTRNETWLKVDDGTNSLIYIFRWNKGKQEYKYWLPPRIQQKINDLTIFKDKILSCTDDGKILEELAGEDFNGTSFDFAAVTPKVNFGNYNGDQECRPILFVDNFKNNNFTVDYIINGDTTNPKTFEIEVDNSGSGIFALDDTDELGAVFAVDDDDPLGSSFATVSLNRVTLKRARSKGKKTENSLQFIFRGTRPTNDVGISALELTRIKKKIK